MKTKEALAQREWHIVDADGKILGRMASEIARVLRGKNKVIFTPNADTGDFVIVINAKGVRLSGHKLDDKIYYRHTNYPGGIRSRTAADLLENKPEDLIHLAVKGMLPKNRLGRKLAAKLKVYSGAEHPHEAQKPKPLAIRA
jgi:large subunit ribosomal protein L13